MLIWLLAALLCFGMALSKTQHLDSDDDEVVDSAMAGMVVWLAGAVALAAGSLIMAFL